ncbi:Para-hydroxybenzoate--polyprenyltransferase, mitochondrial precursor (PHB:polyprenyltransferase) [Trebouxia sp. C0009 RCD-2024]
MPPKKSKSSKSKKLNETDEERAARLETEAAAAQEGARRREEAARLRLVERQQKEQAYGHMNGVKIHNQWRRIMRMAKTEDLKQDIEILSQSYDRSVDRKDALIQALDRDLEDAEEQYGTALRGHLQVVDSLQDMQYARMKTMQEQFQSNLKASFEWAPSSLQEEFDSERTDMSSSHSRQKKEMADLMTAMEAEFAEADSEARQEFEAAREEIRNRSSEEYNVLKISLEGQIEELERTFEAAHQAYLQNTGARATAFQTLTVNDAAAARVIEQRMKKLVQMQESLSQWRTKIGSTGREWEERQRALQAEKDIMARHYSALKAAMEHFRGQQNTRLKHLSANSANANKELKRKLESAERILKLGELCRKLETEQEKVLPFCTPEQALGLHPPADQQDSRHLEADASATGLEDTDHQGMGRMMTKRENNFKQSSCHAVDAAGNPVSEWEYLNNFFKRYNKAFLDKAAVDKERARLAAENADLRTILQQYLDGISVNEAVMNNPVNPLLVINQRLQLTLAERNKLYKQPALQPMQPMSPTIKAVRPQLVEVSSFTA